MQAMVILCVDDESMVLQSLKDQLLNFFRDKCNIEVAESGEEALEIFTELFNENYEIPVVISDYLMPVMKGDELLEKIHEISPRTSNIMLTGQAVTAGVINAVNHANLFRYIGKPWTEEELKTAVNEAIECYYRQKKSRDENEKLMDAVENLRRKMETKTYELADLHQKLGNAEILSDVEKFTEMLLLLKEISGFLEVINTNIVSLDKLHTNVSTDNIQSFNAHLRKEKSIYRKTTGEIEKILTTVKSIKAPPASHADCLENALKEIENRMNRAFMSEC